MQPINKQTLLDVALQQTGTIESVMDIAVANDISITSVLRHSDDILIPIGAFAEDGVTQYLQLRNIKPGTGEAAFYTGIGNWKIGVDFVIGDSTN